MTRVWLLSANALPALRHTNDVDIAISPESPSSQVLRDGLLGHGYILDPYGHPFRLQRMTKDYGLLIIDLLVDETRAISDPNAYPVYGLDFAISQLAFHTLRLRGFGQDVDVAVPSLDRAAVLRLLALEQGTDNAKFDDYAKDAALLAALSVDSGGPSLEVRNSPQFTSARSYAAALFSDLDAPGSRAAAKGSEGDIDLVARRLSAAVTRFLAPS
jgi:hypothetical protein